MGLDHKLVEERLPGIVEYADLGEFIDAPIKTYSSGMRARLGLRDRDVGRAGHPDPRRGAVHRRRRVPREVQAARRRAGPEAKAIVLVTHDMNWVTEYCNRAMLIEKGHIVADGHARTTSSREHQERSAKRRAEQLASRASSPRRRSSRRAARPGRLRRPVRGAPGDGPARGPRFGPGGAATAFRDDATAPRTPRPAAMRAPPVEQRPHLALDLARRSGPAPRTAA